MSLTNKYFPFLNFRALLKVAVLVLVATLASAQSPDDDDPVGKAPDSEQLDDAPVDQGTLILEFRGAHITENMLRVLTTLYAAPNSGGLMDQPYKVRQGDTLCRLLIQRLALPGCSRELTNTLFAVLNREFEANSGNDVRLSIDQQVLLPELSAQTFTYTVRVSPDDKAAPQYKNNILHGVEGIGAFEAARIQGRFGFRVILEGRRLNIPVSENFDYRSAIRSIRAVSGYDVGIAYDRAPPAHKEPTRYSRVTHERKEQSNPIETSFLHELSWLRNTGNDLPWVPPSCAIGCDGSEHCPELVLIDGTVSAHPELDGRVRRVDFGNAGLVEKELASPAPECPRSADGADVDFDPVCHHATSLAGVMAAAADGQGTSGVMPQAELSSFNQVGAHADKIGRFITAMQGETLKDNRPRVFVYASKFPPDDGRPSGQHSFSYGDAHLPKQNRQTDSPNYGRLLGPGCNVGNDVRFCHETMRPLYDLEPLWINAIGEFDGIQAGGIKDITNDIALAPMNLGDAKHVINVTACDPCDEAEGKDWERSRISSSMPYLAAPGIDLRTPADENSYTTAGGTSQAAAFVGGVAAAMLSCNGRAYIDKQMIDAGRIKSRLLSTARPITLDPRRKGKLVGVVDPRAAILSPDKTWLRSDRHVIARRITADSEPYQAYEEAKWCLERVEYKLIGQPGELKSLTTANIVSMRRWPTADSTSWYIDTATIPQFANGQIERIGPLTLRIPQSVIGKEPPLIKLGKHLLGTSEVHELLIDLHQRPKQPTGDDPC